MKKVVSGVMFGILLASILTLAFNVQPVRSDYVWTETIYIRSDGSVEPLGAPISTVDNVTYTLTDNINVGNVPDYSIAIVLERDSIVLDGANYKVFKGYNTQMSKGIYFSGRSNVTIKRLAIWQYWYSGIYVDSSYGVNISENEIVCPFGYGIQLYTCSESTIDGNTIYANGRSAISIYSGSNNSIEGNDVSGNYDHGIYLGSSNSSVVANHIYHNYCGIVIGSSYNVISGNNVTGPHRYGIECRGSYNVIGNNKVTNNVEVGILVASDAAEYPSCNNSVVGNEIADNEDYGISIYLNATNNSINENAITRNGCGIRHGWAPNNSISGNNITNNNLGIHLYCPEDNRYWHNNFIANIQQTYVQYSFVNAWDDDYPSGGNYWSDYNGSDVRKGPNQDVAGSDGLGDTPYTIDANNRDRYPLAYPYGSSPPSTFTLGITAAANGTTDPAPGTYVYSEDQNVPVQALPDNLYALDHWELDETNVGSVNPYSVLMDNNHTLHAVFRVGFHDVAVTDVTAFPAVVRQGFCTDINVTAENQGDFAETFNVTLYANATQIGKQAVTGLDSGVNRLLAFSWNTTDFDIGNYTLSAVADTVENETDTLDNTCVDGTVTVRLSIHDVAVLDVAPASDVVLRGLNLNINGTVENHGELMETFNVTAYANATVVEEKEISLDSGESAIVVFVWNTTEFSVGNYTVSVNATIVLEETDVGDNTCANGVVTVRGPGDIAVVDVTRFKTVVGLGYTMSINVTVENQGDYLEDFNVTAYSNTTEIDTFANVILTSGNSTTITFLWSTSGLAYGNYTMSANATLVPDETDTGDNFLTDGKVYVGIPGDVNGDGVVNILDSIILGNSFLATPSSSSWNPNADINDDKVVNILDSIIVGNHFLEHHP